MSNFTLGSVIKKRTPKPPRIVIHGVQGIGKTTFLSKMPNPILIPIEDGLGDIDIEAFPQALAFDDVMRALGSLYTEPHDYLTVGLDTMDALEPMVWAETARRGNKASIESWDYGKGFQFASEVWAELFQGLDALRNERNMSVVLISHSEIKSYTPPDADPYDRYQLKLHRRASALVQEWADVVAFAHWETFTKSTDLGFKKTATRGLGTGNRLLALEERPAWNAKNRYSLPAEMPLDGHHFLQVLSSRFNAPPAAASADTAATAA